MKLRNIFFVLPLLFVFFNLQAQDSYQIGDKIENFSLKNIDGKMLSMDADDASVEGYILVFTCNQCPYSVLYEDRIIALDNALKAQGFPVIAINPNDAKIQPGDSYEEMIVRAKEKDFPFPYLHDESQEIAKAFGATRTPHVFIVQKENSDFILKYIGAIDDSARDESAIEEKYVEEAIQALKSGNKVANASTKAIGCSIKWKKS